MTKICLLFDDYFAAGDHVFIKYMKDKHDEYFDRGGLRFLQKYFFVPNVIFMLVTFSMYSVICNIKFH